MEQHFAKVVESLASVGEFVAQFAAESRLSTELTQQFQLAIEEVFVNYVRHNRESSYDITVQLSVDENIVRACLIDRDVERYDPTTRPAVDTGRPIADRRPGGLGVHFIKEMMDDFIYEYDNRTCRITLIKHLGTANV
jgi:anti-sigma regulatory factor (Ser/Thr protein kinase)